MKIEMDEQTGWTTVLCFLIAAIATVGIGGCHLTEQTKREALKAGLVEKQNPGTQHTIWTKPD